MARHRRAPGQSVAVPRWLHGLRARWSATGTRWSAAAVVRAKLLFDDTRADLRHHEAWEAVLHPLGEAGDLTEVGEKGLTLR